MNTMQIFTSMLQYTEAEHNICQTDSGNIILFLFQRTCLQLSTLILCPYFAPCTNIGSIVKSCSFSSTNLTLHVEVRRMLFALKVINFSAFINLFCPIKTSFFKFSVDMSPFLGPLMPLFRTSGDISSGFQNQSGQPYSHLAEAYVIYVP